MANISYKRTFTHDDWIDNEDVVQAGGEKGFNKKFHEFENELDEISKVIGEIDVSLQKGIKIKHIITLSKQLNADQITNPEDFDLYDNADFPAGVRKVYQVSIEPNPGAHGQITYNLIYEQAAGNKTKVSIWFKNEKNVMTRFNTHVVSLS